MIKQLSLDYRKEEGTNNEMFHFYGSYCMLTAQGGMTNDANGRIQHHMFDTF